MSSAAERLRNFSIERVIHNWQSVDLSLPNLLIDVRTFWEEYLYRFPTLPFYLELRFDPQTQTARFYSPEYASWLKVDSRERNGAVSQALDEIVAFMQTAPDGSLAYFTSPPGPTGLPDRPNHAESQTFVYQKHNHQITAFTLITDLSLLESERLLRKNSHFIPDLDQSLENRLQAVVSHPVFLTPQASFFPNPHQIISLLEAEMDTLYALPDISFSYLHYLVDHPGTLRETWAESSRIQTKLDNFCRLITSLSTDEPAVINAIAQNLPILLAEISAATRNIPEGRVNYTAEFAYIDSLTGCNGGGVNSVSASAFGTENLSCSEIICPLCGWKPDAAQASRIQAGLLTRCPCCNYNPSTRTVDIEPKVLPPQPQPISLYLPKISHRTEIPVSQPYFNPWSWWIDFFSPSSALTYTSAT